MVLPQMKVSAATQSVRGDRHSAIDLPLIQTEHAGCGQRESSISCSNKQVALFCPCARTRSLFSVVDMTQALHDRPLFNLLAQWIQAAVRRRVPDAPFQRGYTRHDAVHTRPTIRAH